VGPNLLDALGVPRPTASRLFDPTGQRSLIASCTTVPSRLPQLHHAVQSICEQNMRPDKVVVAVPLESQSLRSLSSYAETMPSELRALREGGCPIVFIRGDDFGPATKLIPALLLAARDDDLIVTFDDDNWYSPELLSSLVSHEAAYPNAVLAHSGYTLKGSPWRHPNFAYVRGNDLRHNIPAPVHIIAGFLGVMYKRRFFGSSDDRSASAAAAKGAARPHASGVHDASAAAVRATRNLIDGLLPVRRPRPCEPFDALKMQRVCSSLSLCFALTPPSLPFPLSSLRTHSSTYRSQQRQQMWLPFTPRGASWTTITSVACSGGCAWSALSFHLHWTQCGMSKSRDLAAARMLSAAARTRMLTSIGRSGSFSAS